MCHVEVDGVTGVKSCITPLSAGMRINRQDYKPFYAAIPIAVMRRIHFPAGFYYRMFTRPRWVRDAFVRTVRRLAGVGRIDDRPQPPRTLPPPPELFSQIAERYDVAVVGAGMSGLAAALAASDAGADVLLVDEYAAAGGHAIGPLAHEGQESARDELLSRIAGTHNRMPNIQLAYGSTAQGFYAPDRLLLGREATAGAGGGLKVVVAGAFVFATGAQDVIPLFENNDLPGIFGARGLRLFLERDALVPGRDAVVYGGETEVESSVALLESWGVGVRAVAVTSSRVPTGLRDGTRVIAEATLSGVEGRDWIDRAVFDTPRRGRLTVPCDLLCISLAGQPSFELPQQAGFRYTMAGGSGRDDSKLMFPNGDALVEGPPPARYLVGGAAGVSGWEEKIAHAARAGEAAARAARTAEPTRV
jgi:sarcosine oxidase subunit alpha